MTWNMRPLSVTILAWVYIGVGTIGFVSHFTEIHARNAFQYDGILIEVVEVLAIVCGALNVRLTENCPRESRDGPEGRRRNRPRHRRLAKFASAHLCASSMNLLRR
jgi:hypothetical protein